MGEMLIGGFSDGSIRVFKGNKCTGTGSISNTEISAISVPQDGNTVVIGTVTGVIYLAIVNR